MTNPFILVLFGATGDLAHHKLIPALFSLFTQKQLPEQFFIIGFARRSFSDEEFAGLFGGEGIHEDWEEFAKHLSYQRGTFEDESGYLTLAQTLRELDEKLGKEITKIFYLATPPDNYEMILENLHMTKLSEKKTARIAIEKPFGKDVETAKMLDQKLCDIFNENQIFRVDHYLGKETVQNLLVFRFANSIFDPVWNKDYIDHVQITFAEKKGINGRGKFFDGVGMLRDVAQNHLMQLIASVVMEMPKSFSREDVRDARAKAIQSIICTDPKNVSSSVVRGQYEGYTHEIDVSPHSETETYIAAKFFVHTQRFAAVPFYMRAGKYLTDDSVTISLVFQQACHLLFKEVGCPEEGNVLTIRIQPNEGLFFKIIAKTPGTKLALETAEMHFSYHEQFGTYGTDAYQRLLLDSITGDQMLFNRSDELNSSWKFITNILEGWEKEKSPLLAYPKGSMGPKEGERLMEKDGRKWI